MKRFVITEEEKKHIMGLYEQPDASQPTQPTLKKPTTSQLDGAKITKLIISSQGVGSSVTLSNGESYSYSEGSGYKLPTMGYSYQCEAGEYAGNQLPQYCSVYITLKDKTMYSCDGTGCKKENRGYREKVYQ